MIDNLSVQESLSRFRTALLAQGTKSVTVQGHLWRLGRFKSAYGEQLVSHLTRYDIDELVASWTLSELTPASILSMVKSLKQFTRWLHAYDLTEFDVASHLAVNSLSRDAIEDRRQKTHAIPEADFRLLWQSANTSLEKAILAWLIDTGARPSETVSLAISKLDFDELTAEVRGKGSSRIVTFTDFAVPYLREWLQERPACEHDLVFCSISPQWLGRPYSLNGLNQIFRRLAERASLDHNPPKSVRHLIGYRFTRLKDLESARRKLGHKDIRTTAVYANILPELVQRDTKELTLLRNL